MWKKEKIHLETFAVDLCAYFAEVVHRMIVKCFIEPKSIVSSRFYSFDTWVQTKPHMCQHMANVLIL